jgi:hypothetical protein
MSISHAAWAQEAAPAKPFKTQELDQMLAPIALYPDDLLTNVLVGATYPLEIVQAARWRKQPDNKKLKGAALEKTLEAQEWDPSVKALTQVPDVLQTMNDKLDWTQKLGDAFVAQQDEVMQRVQFLRKKADEAGSLKTNKQQKVTKRESYIVIEPANPEVIYVPAYQPAVVYGSWWYPDYPPYYWPYGYPASSFVSGFFWGAGVAIAANAWGWGNCNWGRNDIDINVNKYNNINRNRQQISSNKWQHDPKHRGSVPYRDKASREKFGKKDAKRREAAKDFRGFDKAGTRDKVADRGDKLGDRSGKVGERGDKAGDRGGRAGDRGDRAGADRAKGKDRAGAKGRDRAGATDRARKPAASRGGRPGSNALNVQRGSDVRRHASRGQASRSAMASRSRPPQVSRGGGGRSFGGGGRGGGRGGGGGRRSDIRLKHDIVLLGRLDNGLGYYRFAYHGSRRLYVGVMAQEAAKVMPEAVSRDAQGYLRVRYDMLGISFQTYDAWLQSGRRLPRTVAQ